MNYAQETTALADEAMEHFHAHGLEVTRGRVPIRIDMETYYRAEHAGCLRVYTARDEEGKLAGYAIYYIAYHPHYGTLQAVQDGMYVIPAYRGSFISAPFLKWIHVQLQAEGARDVYQAVPSTNDFGIILKRLGFSAHEVVYHKSLEAQH